MNTAQTALQVTPQTTYTHEHIQAQYEQARLLHSQGQYEKSNHVLEPLLPVINQETLYILQALNLLRLHKHKESYLILERIIKQNPNSSLAYLLLGDIFIDKKDDKQAYICYQRSYELEPNTVDIHNRLVNYYSVSKDRELIKKHSLASLQINSKQPEILKKIAYTYGLEENYGECLKYYKYLLSFEKAEEIYHFIGLVYSNNDEYEKALEYFHASLQTFAKTDQNAFLTCSYNVATAYHKLGSYEKAKQWYFTHIAHDNGHQKSHWGLSVLYLLHEDYENGWAKYEWRRKFPDFHTMTHGLLEGTPEYNGEDLEGKIVSIHSEQGYGDTIQFFRFLAVFAYKMKVKKIIFRAHSFVYPLVRPYQNEKCEIYPEGYKHVKHLTIDYQLPLMSLPYLLKLGAKDIVGRAYLETSQSCPVKLDRNKVNIGLAWQGNRKNKNVLRNLQVIEFIPLFDEKYDFYSLQLKDENQEIAKANLGSHIYCVDEHLTDFRATAALIKELDVVITADTVIAHLAGALGKKVILLLQYAPDWRWLLDRSDSPWYDSMIIFRQHKIYSFTEAIEDVREYLTKNFTA